MSDADRILAERARSLARPATFERAAAGESYLTFRLGSEMFALEARFIRQIAIAGHVAALPRAERPLIGVTGWRGNLVPVFDLRASADAATEPTRLLMVGDDAPGALAVDAVADFVEIGAGDIHALAPALAAARPYARGITSQAVIVLDGEALLRTLS